MDHQKDEESKVVIQSALGRRLPAAGEAVVMSQLARISVLEAAALVMAIIALIGVIILSVLVYSHDSHDRGQSEAESEVSQTPARPPTAIGSRAQPAGAVNPSTQSRQQESAITDMAIQRELNLKLLDDPELEMHPLDATVDHSRVVLRGRLPSARLRSRAESIVKSVRGVRGVVNQINVNTATG